VPDPQQPISRGFQGRRVEPANRGRVPPGRYVTRDFPVGVRRRAPLLHLRRRYASRQPHSAWLLRRHARRRGRASGIVSLPLVWRNFRRMPVFIRSLQVRRCVAARHSPYSTPPRKIANGPPASASIERA
jgi:hypothetical protein